MEKIQFENNNFILYSPDSLNYITNDMEKILNQSLELYYSLLGVNSFRKVQINYFDDLEKFRNYIYELRGEKDSLPDYAKGTFDNGMINAYIEPNIIEGTPLYNRRKYNASHELFHIMYQELILRKNNMDRIVWFDEGMAQFFSGEFTKEIENFDDFVRITINNTKKVPDLNTLSHGSKFETDDYSGYKLSFIAVKYIYDQIGIQKFRELLYDINKIREYGRNILFEIIENYNVE